MRSSPPKKRGLELDLPAQLARKALALESEILHWQEKSRSQARSRQSKVKSTRDLEESWFMKHIKDAKGVFGRLRTLLSGHTPCTLSERQRAYFLDIFDDANRSLSCVPDDDGKPARIRAQFHLRTLYAAYRFAVDLGKCGHFLTPPQKWNEQAIFAKEDIHASLTNNNTAFNADRKAFFRRYADLSSNGCFRAWDARDYDYAAVLQEGRYYLHEDIADGFESLISGLSVKQKSVFDQFCKLLTPDQRYLLDWLESPEYSDIHDEPADLNMQRELAALCWHYCIEGFDAESVFPQRFRIRMERGSAVICVPNYMKIDWARNIPYPVIDMIRSREHPEIPFHYKRGVVNAAEPARDAFHGELIKLTDELLADYLARKIKTKNEVYDAVLNAFPKRITSSTRREDRRKQVQRLFRRLGVIIPVRLPKNI